ncbi:PaaI family thioesterase [Cobetia marina]
MDVTASEATKDGPHSLLGLAVNRADVPAAGGGLDDASWVRALTGFVSFIPHTARLQVSVDEVAAPAVRMTLPWQAALVGDPHRHLVHGGVLTMFADTLCGSAVLTGLERPEVCPTLDLRLDHYRPGVEGMALIGEARVLRVTESMVFTEAQIWQQPGKLLCRAIGNFVRLGARNTPPGFGEALMAAAQGRPSTGVAGSVIDGPQKTADDEALPAVSQPVVSRPGTGCSMPGVSSKASAPEGILQTCWQACPTPEPSDWACAPWRPPRWQRMTRCRPPRFAMRWPPCPRTSATPCCPPCMEACWRPRWRRPPRSRCCA